MAVRHPFGPTLFVAGVTTRTIGEARGIVRVACDVTSNPPGTFGGNGARYVPPACDPDH